MRIKICGITRVEDAVSAVEAGTDAIGLNFVGGPRQITFERAEQILIGLPPLIVPVALVRLDEGRLAERASTWLRCWGVRDVQLYGPVTRDDLRRLIDEGFRPMPVVAVGDARFGELAEQWLGDDSTGLPSAIVLDAYDPSKEGGTGKAFRWDWVSDARVDGRLDRWPAIILAGGLKPDNVAEAVRVVRPYAVDVSSGVEQPGQPGVKDPELMARFVRNARAAEVAD